MPLNKGRRRRGGKGGGGGVPDRGQAKRGVSISNVPIRGEDGEEEEEEEEEEDTSTARLKQQNHFDQDSGAQVHRLMPGRGLQ